MQFAEKIKQIRTKNHLTQEQFAMRLNVTRQAVSNWESDSSQDPFQIQQSWFSEATGVEENVFQKIPVDYVDYNNVMDFLDEDLQTGQISFTKMDSSASASFTLELTPTQTGNVYVFVESYL